MSTKEEVAGATDDANRRALQEDADVRDTVQQLVSTVPGRSFLWRLLQVGKWGIQPFAGEPHHTAFSCGELNVGQQIFALIASVAPDGLLLMMKERNDARSSDPIAGAAADANAGLTGTRTLAEPDTYTSDGS